MDALVDSRPGSLLKKVASAESYCFNYALTTPFAQFLCTFRHICSYPTLRPLPISATLREYVKKWADSHGGMQAVLSDLELVEGLCAIMDVLVDKFSQAAAASARSSSEALLLASLTDVCRYCMQVTSTTIPYDHHLFVGSTMQSVRDYNYSVIVHTADEMQNHEKLLRLLVIARSTAYHRCDDEVRINITPLLAELLSLFDNLSSGCLVPLDRRRDENLRCRLSGLRLDPSDESAMVDDFVRRYWEAALRLPVPT
ncbi:hypothetical protein TRVL_05592 [Trypanosoma vivax]|nr:hypothetical protein TRVL_05592 [Trypanosoma vivax]